MSDVQENVDYILNKYDLAVGRRMPVVIPNVGRDDLARLFAELGFKKGAEIGVERGRYTEVLCRENPQATIWGVDPWKAYRGYRDHVSQEKLDGFYGSAQRRLAPYGNYRFVRNFSMDVVKHFKNGSLDFVYIDGNHTLPFIINDLIEWSKKVRVGGIVSGHDYRASKRVVTQNHVVYAVHCFTQSYRIRPWFLLGRKEKVPGEVRDGNRSWMWVRA